jgi:hypothetical protein
MSDRDTFGDRWRRWQRSRTSFNWWASEALVGIVLLILGLIAGSTLLIVLGLFVAAGSMFVIYSRWRGQRTPR